jgi:hypothetical protein
MSLRGTPRYKHATRDYHRLFKCKNEWQEMKLIEHENILQNYFQISCSSSCSFFMAKAT